MTRNKTIKIRLTEAEHRRFENPRPRPWGFGLPSDSGTWARPATEANRSPRFALRTGGIRNLLNQVARNSERRPVPEQIQIVAQLISVERAFPESKNHDHRAFQVMGAAAAAGPPII